MKKNLFQSGMTSLYPARIVNSCYFDTHDLKLFSESEEVFYQEKKFEFDGIIKNNFTREVKISSIEGRFKYQKEIYIQKFEDLFNLKIFDKLYGELVPILNVSYEREYFSYKNLRITFDKNITYTYLKLTSKPVLNDSECVMEIKAPINCNEKLYRKINTLAYN